MLRASFLQRGKNEWTCIRCRFASSRLLGRDKWNLTLHVSSACRWPEWRVFDVIGRRLTPTRVWSWLLMTTNDRKRLQFLNVFFKSGIAYLYTRTRAHTHTHERENRLLVPFRVQMSFFYWKAALVQILRIDYSKVTAERIVFLIWRDVNLKLIA